MNAFILQEAVWFGGNDEFIAAGSDCGSLFIWERNSGALIKGFKADNNILNCVQPHPSCCLLATSGIERVIRFWEPLNKNVSEVSFMKIICLKEVDIFDLYHGVRIVLLIYYFIG